VLQVRWTYEEHSHVDPKQTLDSGCRTGSHRTCPDGPGSTAFPRHPAFARKYGVKCYTCHLIPPVLNKTGYMFKRLGYRMPPDEMDGTKPAPKISELDKNIKFNLMNSFAVITQGSFTAEKTAGDSPASKSSFNLDEAALFVAGALPESNFSYFVHYELYQGGQNFLEQAVASYTGGRANSSYFGKAGEMHMQEGEGTRGACSITCSPIRPLFSHSSTR